MPNRYWKFETKLGPILIVPKNGRFEVEWKDEGLGSYDTPAAAADDVAGGHTYTPSSGIDLGKLGIPYELLEWEFIKRA